jgi:hypothetical protein
LQLVPLLPNQVCDGGIAKLWHIDDIVYDIHISVAVPVPSSRLFFHRKNLHPCHWYNPPHLYLTPSSCSLYGETTIVSPTYPVLSPMNIGNPLKRHFILSFPNNVDATEM